MSDMRADTLNTTGPEGTSAAAQAPAPPPRPMIMKVLWRYHAIKSS